MTKLKRNPSTEQAHGPRPKLYLATPAYGGMVTAAYHCSIIALIRSLDASATMHVHDITGNESLVTRARNGLVARFLETDCTHLIFIDADIGFRPEDVARLVWADLDVCGGAYPMKTIGWHNVVAAVKEGQPAEKLAKMGGLYAVSAKVDDEETGEVTVIERGGARFLEVHDLATGFMCIKREAMERFIEHYRDSIAYTPDDLRSKAGEVRWNVFHADMDPVQVAAGKPQPRYLSEDYYFCRRWQQMGGKTYVCIDVALSHTGTHRFEGDVGLLIDDKPTESPRVHNGFTEADVEGMLSPMGHAP